MFDIVLANLIPLEAGPLLADLKELLAPGGFMVLSGLMADQRTSFEAELTGCGLAVRETRELQEWVALGCAAQ
jgi:ribosomal protein L11 methylase PrmA